MAKLGECTALPPGQRPQEMMDATLTSWSTSEDWLGLNIEDAWEEPGDDGLDHPEDVGLDPQPGDEESIIGSSEDEQVRNANFDNANDGEEMHDDEVSVAGINSATQSESGNEDDRIIEGHQFSRLFIEDTEDDDEDTEDDDEDDDEDDEDDIMRMNKADEEYVPRGMMKRKRPSVESNQSTISRHEQVKRRWR